MYRACPFVDEFSSLQSRLLYQSFLYGDVIVNKDEALRKILDGECVLFLGAGFSLGATNTRQNPFKTGPRLAEHFATLVNLPSTTGLEDASDAYYEDFGVDALIREVQEEFTAKTICPHHRGIADLPWQRVYTTNFDNVFEVACHELGKRVTPVTLSADLYKVPKDHLLCVHFNGYVDKLDRTTIRTELKLTESSYVTAAISDTQWAMLFRQDIKLASSIFFVGYSAADLDIKRMLVESEDLAAKLFFYVGDNCDPITQRRVAKYGATVPLTAESFVNEIAPLKANYVPPTKDSLRLLSIHEYIPPKTASPIKDRDFMDLLLWGQRDAELIAESLRTNKIYYLKRSKIEMALGLLASGTRIVVLSSDLGNGKSLLLEGLRPGAVAKGYRVFDVAQHNPGVVRELEAISRVNGNVLIVIEEYQNWLDEIRALCAIAGNNVTLLLTARNAVHDVVIDDLHDSAGDWRLAELNIDQLDDSEIRWVVEALDQYGLWGDQAGLGFAQKSSIIRNDCRRQFHALLLRLLASPDIGERVAAVAQKLNNKVDNYLPLLSIFVLTLLNYPPTLDILIDIWGPEIIGSPQFRMTH
jgi:hypothetical protein